MVPVSSRIIYPGVHLGSFNNFFQKLQCTFSMSSRWLSDQIGAEYKRMDFERDSKSSMSVLIGGILAFLAICRIFAYAAVLSAAADFAVRVKFPVLWKVTPRYVNSSTVSIGSHST